MQKLIQEYEKTLSNLQARHKELQGQLGKNKADNHDLQRRMITLDMEIWELYAAINEMREYVE